MYGQVGCFFPERCSKADTRFQRRPLNISRVTAGIYARAAG